MKDSIIILSGGMDSVTMLYDYADSIALALSFDYGSNHNAKELPLAAYHCEKLRIEHIIIPLEFIKQYFHSSLLSGAADIPEGKYDDVTMRSTVVPFRNGIMLSVAAGMAEDRQLSRILMANHSGDHAIYPDCRPDFVDAMAGAVREGTYNGVELFTPYTRLTKTDIARRGKQLGIDYSKTWSCYKGGDRHCGKCGTCQERRQALAEAGITDTTVYEEECE
jgi:7-cyano-7-deazaguanine synthase